MPLFISFKQSDFPDSGSRRPVESGFGVRGWGFFFSPLSSNTLLSNFAQGFGFVSLLSNDIMILIKTDWFLEKARADWDWEADQWGGL